jgi:hypothetical protein
MRLGITILLLLLCIPSYAMPQEGRFSAAGLKDEDVETFFLSFREAVSSGDKKKVASLISYPIKLHVSPGTKRTIRNQVDFVKAYDRIFDEEFRQLILKTETKDLWARWTGVAMPRGEIWFSGIGTKKSPDKHTIKIIAINGPIRD